MWRRIAEGAYVGLAVAAVLGAPRSAHGQAEPADEAAEAPVARELDAGAASALSGREVTPAPSLPLHGHGRVACSFRSPICVIAKPALAPDLVMRVIDAAEHAYLAYVGPLAFPALPSSTPTNLVLHEGPAGVYDGLRDATRTYDTQSVQAWIDARVAAPCVLEAEAARAVAAAVLARTNPATDVFGRVAQATSVAALVEPCVERVFRAPIEHFLRAHERGFVSADDDAFPDHASAASAFYTWLDVTRAVRPGATLLALAALTPTITPPGASYFINEPDAFDAIRRTFRGSTYKEDIEGELFLAFAIWRATEATRPSLIRDEASLDEHVPWPTAARGLRPKRPLAPTGSSYVLVDTNGAAKHARLRVEASWETHSKMMWAFVRLDSAGRVLSTARIPHPTRSTEVAGSSPPIEGAAEVLVVAVHTGHPVYQLDPDDGALEPHAWEARMIATD